MAFTGEVDQISNKATWISDTYELFDDSDGTTTDLTNPALTDLAIEVTIKDPCNVTFATASIVNGKVLIPGPGFYWRFEKDDLSGLCAGTYKLGVKITMNATIIDEVIGAIGVLEGN